MDQGENGGVRADAQSGRDDRDEREASVAPERPRGVMQILHAVSQPVHVAQVLEAYGARLRPEGLTISLKFRLCLFPFGEVRNRPGEAVPLPASVSISPRPRRVSE